MQIDAMSSGRMREFLAASFLEDGNGALVVLEYVEFCVFRRVGRF